MCQHDAHEKLINTLIYCLKFDISVPLDLTSRLLSEGIDVAALEKQYVK